VPDDLVGPGRLDPLDQVRGKVRLRSVEDGADERRLHVEVPDQGIELDEVPLLSRGQGGELPVQGQPSRAGPVLSPRVRVEEHDEAIALDLLLPDVARLHAAPAAPPIVDPAGVRKGNGGVSFDRRGGPV
jgi:hypothetical protein